LRGEAGIAVEKLDHLKVLREGRECGRIASEGEVIKGGRKGKRLRETCTVRQKCIYMVLLRIISLSRRHMRARNTWLSSEALRSSCVAAALA
jgi:hypothetical protein